MRSTGLAEGEAARLIEDIVFVYREPVEEIVRRRHAELRLRGIRGEQAYERIAAELRTRVVAGPDLTARQIRRVIYG